jgi:hypothetical protein
MTSEEAYTALTTRTDVRISRNLADRALLSAQTHGYYGIDGQDGLRINIRFDADGFHITDTEN